MARSRPHPYYVAKVKSGMQICIPALTLYTPLADRRGLMRQRTLTLLLAFVLVPVFAIACAGGDSESADADADADEEMTMEDGMEEGGDPGHGEEGHVHEEGDEGPAHGEEGHVHMEGDEGPAHGEEGHVHVEGDEMGDTAAMPDTSGSH